MKYYSFHYPEISILKTVLIVSVFVIPFLFTKKIKLLKIRDYFKSISKKIYIEIIGLSFLRYVFFSHQFILLLYLFSADTDYFTSLNLLFSMYLIASVIPSISVFDWVIKGSIAVWLFGFIGVNEITILTITTIMWLLNFAIPAIIGSIFVLNFKLEKSK